MKYLSIENGFLAEEMKVEAGELLPELTAYFNEEYKLDEKASISYLNGNKNLEVSDFTYVKDENTYVRGTQNLTALIKTNNQEYKTKLVIEDTIAPVVSNPAAIKYVLVFLSSLSIFINFSFCNSF
jgi:hypothetical protein